MKSIEKFYDMPMGGYCGVLIREKQAKRLMKLLHKQSQEIKELLASNLDQLEVSNWTLAYPESKQVAFNFYTPSTDKEKIERISLIDKAKQVQYCKDGVFVVDEYNKAKDVFMDWYEKTN